MRVHAGRNHRHEHAAALVVTLIVCTVLAIVVVALMQNTGLDRASSAGMTNHYRAKLAAESGASAAMATVADLVSRYPDSVTVWQNIGGGAANGTNNEATVLYFRASGGNSNVGASPAAFGSQVGLWAMPLVSRTSAPTSLNNSPVALASIVNSVPLVSGVTTNLNATNSVYTEPFVGSRTSTNAGAPVAAGQWVYITKFGGATNATNPYVARFAYWVEDESFKVNLNVATNGNRGSGLGLTPAETRLNGSLGTSTNSQLQDAAVADRIVADRNIFGPSGFPTLPTAALASGLTSTDARAELAFLTTTKSSGLNFSRGGFLRYDINNATHGGSVAYRLNADRLIAAVTNSNASPLFGQRFYRQTNDVNAVGFVTNTGTATAGNHALIYLNKLAANIIDYIDVDSLPTIFDNPTGAATNYFLRPVPQGGPSYGIEALGGGESGTNSAAAIGVENVPRLQEYAVHARINQLDPIGYHTTNTTPPPPANLGLSIDYYFEFWNPGTEDIELPPDTYLTISDQPSFFDASGGLAGISGSLTNREQRLSKIVLSNAQNLGTGLVYSNGITFPAGSATVLTTSPTNLVNTNLLRGNSNNVVSIFPSVDPNDRLFNAVVDTNSVVSATETNIGGTNYNRFFSIGSQRSHGNAHYLTSVLLANSNGILDSAYGLPITVPLTIAVTNQQLYDAIGNVTNGNRFLVRGGGLRGNEGSLSGGRPRSTEGDARTLNEQLQFQLHSTGAADATRFYDSDSGLNDIPTSSTIGSANLGTYTIGVNPSLWTDYSFLSGGFAFAPLILRNGNLESVSELGHITDPARVPGTESPLTSVVYARGGGRTLRIGQPELPGWYDGNQTSASRNWTSWRLVDIFTTTNAVIIDGLLNPNGALRDGGAALYAALNGITYLGSPSGGAPNTANVTVTSNNIRTLVTNVISRLTNENAFNPAGSLNPFWERGEISELPILNSGTTLLGSGINLSNTIDRGREELVRRSIEMITPRGNVFTVYAIGQSIQTTATATNVLSTVRLKSTFQLDPVVPVAAVDDLFTPTDSAAVAARFAAITNFTLEIISRSYD